VSTMNARAARLAAQLCWGGGTFRQCQLPIADRRPHNGQR
jgi:hypothetical protein